MRMYSGAERIKGRKPMRGVVKIWNIDSSGNIINRWRWRIEVDWGPHIKSRRGHDSQYDALLAARRWAKRFGIILKKREKAK